MSQHPANPSNTIGVHSGRFVWGRAHVFKIHKAEFLAPGIKRFTIEAPRIARKQKPGQFVILRVHATGERIPLTIACSDPEAGTIDIIVQSQRDLSLALVNVAMSADHHRPSSGMTT